MAGDLEPEVLTAWRPLVEAGFFSPDECRQIRAAMDAGHAEPAEVLGAAIEVEGAVRHASEVEVDDDVLAGVERRLDALRPGLEAFYAMLLTDREGPGFVRYAPGGFYRPHRDNGALPSWPGAARRRIAVVIFLNDSQAPGRPGAFTGGTLRLWPDDGADESVDVVPREGMLVAFPASMTHEVTPVQQGTRDAVIDWFY